MAIRSMSPVCSITIEQKEGTDMTKVDIFSGFLGAGKTTLIKKLVKEVFAGKKIVLIENEFGEIGIDGGFLKDAGINITEMNSGCICCSLVGDFGKALKKVADEYHPDRIIIEPSGVGKLSDVAKAVEHVEGAHIGAKVTVVDAGKCRMYMRNFGEFFNDQVENADLIVMSRTDITPEAKVQTAADMLRTLNHDAGLITTPLDKISGEQILEAMDKNGLRAQMEELEHEHEHHHDHDDDDDDCCCGHDHDHEHEEHEHHHHDHDHGDECSCGCHDHDHEHHHHHHADEVFTSWGMETPRKFTEESLKKILEALDESAVYGTILRAKGIVDASDGDWLYFDYTPGEYDVRRGNAAVTGRFCVIGSKLNEQALKELFEVE